MAAPIVARAYSGWPGTCRKMLGVVKPPVHGPSKGHRILDQRQIFFQRDTKNFPDMETQVLPKMVTVGVSVQEVP